MKKLAQKIKRRLSFYSYKNENPFRLSVFTAPALLS
jgi:hypothetical protein